MTYAGRTDPRLHVLYLYLGSLDLYMGSVGWFLLLFTSTPSGGRVTAARWREAKEIVPHEFNAAARLTAE
jgi:hypothetical protein